MFSPLRMGIFPLNSLWFFKNKYSLKNILIPNFINVLEAYYKGHQNRYNNVDHENNRRKLLTLREKLI